MAIDPSELEIGGKYLRLIEELAKETGKTHSEIINQLLDYVLEGKQAYEELRRNVETAIAELGRGEGEELDIDAIKAELTAELNEDGTPK